MKLNLPASLKTPLLFFGIWFLSGLALLQSAYISAVVLQIAFVVFVASWFFANRLLRETRLSSQINLIAALIFYFSSWQWNNLLENVPPDSAWFFLREIVFQIFLLLQLFSFGHLLIKNSSGRQGILLLYGALALAGHGFVYTADASGLMSTIFVPVLFLFLLNQTRWIEDLHKRTLGLFFLAFVLLLYLLLNSYPSAPFSGGRSWTWLTIPGFMRHLLLAYLAALLVKIPAVIIYNHITLERKLWFAGLFQSFLPQIVQFGLMILLFYFFIAGWQAQNLAENIVKNLQDRGRFVNAAAGALSPDLTYGVWEDSAGSWHIFERTSEDSVKAMPLDKELMSVLWAQSEYIFGNGLLAYPAELSGWQKTLNENDYWQRNNDIKFYSLSFWPQDAPSKRAWFEEQDSAAKTQVFNLDTESEKGIVFGRVFLPFISESAGHGIMALDIVLNKKTIPLSDPIVGMVTLLILIFFVINTVVIRQVVAAGNRIHKTIINKFSQLKKGIREIAGGNLKYKVTMQGEDEFSELARHFNGMADKLEDTLQQARDKERLNQEWNIAREVQLDLLPRKLVQPKGYNVVARLQTAQEVSGDLYDMICMDDGSCLFTIGDVSGKGASAAFYMAQFISLFRFSARYINSPREIAAAINQYMCTHINDNQIFVTAIIGMLDPASDELQWVRCGHNSPLLLQGSASIQAPEIKGLGLGLTSSEAVFEKSLETGRISLKENDAFVLYTDGIVEATRSEGEEKIQYGDDRFKAVLRENQKLPAERLMEEIFHDLDIFYAGQPTVDDMTLMIIQKKSAGDAP